MKYLCANPCSYTGPKVMRKTSQEDWRQHLHARAFGMTNNHMGVMFDYLHNVVLSANDSDSEEPVALCWSNMSITVTFLL